MMTMDDAFDAKLRAAFASADAQTRASPELVANLVKKLGRANRQRWMVLASAAGLGSLIAASQLEQIAEEFTFETGLLAHVFAVMPPENMVSIALAAIMAIFGFILPAHNR